MRSHSCTVLNQIRVRLWCAICSLIQLVTALMTSPSDVPRRGRAAAADGLRRRVRRVAKRSMHYAIDDRWPSEVPILQPLPEQHQTGSSQAKIFKRSARLQRKTKIVPENGSCPSRSRTSAANPSAPLRKSTGLVAIRTRIPAGTVMILPPSRRKQRPSANPDQRPAPHAPPHQRSRSLSSRLGQPRHPPTRQGPPQPEQHRHRVAGQNQSSGACRLAPSKQMLGTDLVLARDFADNCTRRVPFTTIRPFSSSRQRRRRPTPTRISTRLCRSEASTICQPYMRTSPKSVRIFPLSPPAARWGQRTAYGAAGPKSCRHPAKPVSWRWQEWVMAEGLPARLATGDAPRGPALSTAIAQRDYRPVLPPEGHLSERADGGEGATGEPSTNGGYLRHSSNSRRTGFDASNVRAAIQRV